jgi:glyoxylase-like metal-dependent hydrolase (beta-lactamase superfamily II)
MPTSSCFTGLGLLAAMALGPTRPVSAQAAFEFRRLANGIYMTVQADPLHDPVQGNTIAIVNDDDVVVVDANILPSMTREVIAAIRRVTDKPVRYLINTHAHSDHHYTNQLYRQTWPGVEIVAHPLTRLDIIETDLPTFEPNWRTHYPAAAAQLRAQLAADTSASGVRLTAAQRSQLQDYLAMYEAASREWSTLQLVPPTLTVSDSLVLHRGHRRIVIQHLGRGNTRGDLVVYLPEERIVITGDLLVAPIPFAFGAFLEDWIVTMRRLRALPAVLLLPGHGPPQEDREHLDKVQRLLESTWSEVQAAVTEGLDLQATLRRVTLEASRRELAGDDPRLVAAFEGFFRQPAITQAFKDARGEPRERP